MEHFLWIFFCASFPPTITMTETATQLELIISMLKDQSTLINETKALLAESQAKVAVLETKVATLELTVDALNADVVSLKEQLNFRNQEGKLNNARIFGVPYSDEETKATDGGESFKKLVYDRYIKPCLNAARANGDIPTVPHAVNTIAKLYRLGKPGAPGTRPPPLLLSFANHDLRNAVFRNKKACFPSPSDAEKEAGVKRYVMVEDLTSPTYSLLKELQDHSGVAKAWTIEGRIRFTRVDKPNEIIKIKSVFTHIEKIIRDS